jgi:hypothetical protein
MAKRMPDRRISIRSIRKDPPDLRKLGRAFIALAVAEAEKEAQAQGEGAARSSDNEGKPSEEKT